MGRFDTWYDEKVTSRAEKIGSTISDFLKKVTEPINNIKPIETESKISIDPKTIGMLVSIVGVTIAVLTYLKKRR